MHASKPDTVTLTGEGRSVLLRRIAELEKRAAELEQLAERALASERTMFGTLTSAQESATRSLMIARAVKSIGDDPIMQQLAPLGASILRARGLHPRGVDGIRSLAEEVGEVANAMRRETPERVREELIDVATVAMRWAIGDVAQ